MPVGASCAVICPETAGTGALQLPPCAAGLAGALSREFIPRTCNSVEGGFLLCLLHKIYSWNMDREALMSVFEFERVFAAGRNYLAILSLRC